MPIDLEKLSPRELHELIASAQKQISNSLKARVVQVRAKIQALLREEGLNFEDVYGGKLSSRGAFKSQSVPKYAHPKEPSLTWSGRGKRPRWFVDALASGKSEKSLLINKEGGDPPAPVEKKKTIAVRRSAAKGVLAKMASAKVVAKKSVKK